MRIYYLGLEAFVAIADNGSFSKAAGMLHLTQTALTHRLKKVESELGTPLLNRSSRTVSLTPSGRDLLPQARRLLKELAEAYETVRIRAQHALDTLSFACVPSIANSLIPVVLAEFSRARPNVAIHLRDLPVHMVDERILSGEAEFGITVISTHLADLRATPLVEEEYVLLVPVDHTFARRGGVTRDDLVGQPMARISTQSKNRQLVDIAFNEYRDRMVWKYEVRNGAAAMALVAHGLAFTILPQSVTAVAPANLVAVPFQDVKLSRKVGVVRRQGVPLSATAQDLLDRITQRLIDHERTRSINGRAPRN